MKIYAAVNLPKYTGTDFKFSGLKLADVISKALNYAIALAGVSMFGILIAGGFDLLTSGGNPEGIKKGTNKIVYALTGFIVVLGTYFILQFVELVFGIKITG